MTASNQDFAKAAAEVSIKIEAFKKMLFDEVERYNQKIPEKHEGKQYHKAVLAFARQINGLEKRNKSEIINIASRISSLSQYDWEANEDIIQLWHSFAVSLTAFSEHPSKKVATLIISDDNKLQAYGVNRLPPSIVKRAPHFVRGIRSSFFMCSERMAFINYYKLSIKPWWDLKRYSRKLVNEIEQKEIRRLSTMADDIGKHSAELKNSTLITTATPCLDCAKSIINHGLKNLIADNVGHHFTRYANHAAAEALIRAHGIRMRKVNFG